MMAFSFDPPHSLFTGTPLTRRRLPSFPFSYTCISSISQEPFSILNGMHRSTALDYVKSGNDSQFVCHNAAMMDTYSAVRRDEVFLVPSTPSTTFAVFLLFAHGPPQSFIETI